MMEQMDTVKVAGGADYAMVVTRIHKFVEHYKNGQIITELVKYDDLTGEAIFKANIIVDGIIRGTGHAMEVRGASNINKTSHVECAETSAVGRALAMMGYMPKGQIASYEEVENAKLQQSKIEEHEKMFETTLALLSTTFQNAIDDDDEEGILECLKDMHGNQALRQAVNKTLSNEQSQYLTERQAKLSEANKIKSEEKLALNKKLAKDFAEKQKAK